MGKEIIRSRNQEPTRKFSAAQTAMRVGLASLAIAAVPFVFDGCSKNPSSPSQAPGITDNSPQFPNTGSDRPLQSQPKKEIVKSPEDLLKALVTMRIQQTDLPPGMVAGAATAVDLDPTLRMAGAKGIVAFTIGDDNLTGIGQLSFIVFSNSQDAEREYSNEMASAIGYHPIGNFPYPMSMASFSVPVPPGWTDSPSTIVRVLAQKGNVIATTMMVEHTRNGTESDAAKSKTIDVMKTALAQLENTSR